jgi:hypothetical protein
MGVSAQQPLERGVQVASQLGLVGTARSGQCAYYHQATGGQKWQTVPDEMTQPALDQVALHGTADGLAHDETRTCGGNTPPRHVRVRVIRHSAAQVDDQQRPTGPAPAPNRFSEVLAPPQPVVGGQHGMIRWQVDAVRRKGGRGPCCGASR